MKRSQRKKENKAKRASSRRDPEVKRGYRKLVIDGAIYQWRYYGYWVEIRVPGKLKLKWLVPIWQLNGYDSKEAWEEEYKDCWGDDPCDAYWVQPKLIRKYIDEMRTATCNEGGHCGCKK